MGEYDAFMQALAELMEPVRAALHDPTLALSGSDDDLFDSVAQFCERMEQLGGETTNSVCDRVAMWSGCEL